MKTLSLLLLLSLLACSSRQHNFPEATLENATLLAEQAQNDVGRVISKTITLECKDLRRRWEKILESEDLTPEDRKKIQQALDDIEMIELGNIQSSEMLDLREKELYE